MLKNTLLTLAFATLLSACGGGGGLVTSTLYGTSAAPELINGIEVPPDPGAARDDTLAGVDMDHNGIRDEIDRWIATSYASKPGALDAVRMVARSDQKLLESKPATQTEARSAIYESMDIGSCTWRKLDQEGVPSSNLFNESMIRTYDTKERIEARKTIFNLAGMILRRVGDASIVCPYVK